MTERLREIEQRCEKATPQAECSMLLDQWIEWRESPPGNQKYTIATFERESDQEFFYHAREDIPYLLSVIKEQAEDNELLCDLVKQLRESNGEHSAEKENP